MLAGSRRPIVLPENYSPPTPEAVDVNLATHLVLRFGRLAFASPQMVRDINNYIRSLNLRIIWNSCNGLEIDREAELSLDATPRNYSFVNGVIKSGGKPKRNYVTVQKYFQNKYNIHLNYPYSPLLRDNGGRMYPIETVWCRIEI